MRQQSRGVPPRNAQAKPRMAPPRIVDRSINGCTRACSSAAACSSSITELSANLAALHALLKQLAERADAKLSAMRAADAQALQACAAAETELLQQVAGNAQERQAILARLAQHLPAPLRPDLSLSDLIEKFPEPQASVLRARSVALRDSAAQLHEKNRLAARVAHHLQTHIRAVFAELAKVNQESLVYGPKGQHEQAGLRSCLDAVG